MNIEEIEMYLGVFSEDRRLNIEKMISVMQKFLELSEVSKEIFLEILRKGSVSNFKDFFEEKDFSKFMQLYTNQILKGNFIYQIAIICCLKKYEPISYVY